MATLCGNYSNLPFARSILTKQKHFNETNKKTKLWKKSTKKYLIWKCHSHVYFSKDFVCVYGLNIFFLKRQMKKFIMELNPIGCVRKTLRSFQNKTKFLNLLRAITKARCVRSFCLQKNKFISFYWFREHFMAFSLHRKKPITL